ncbi:MAG: HAMP domain-containing protein, partial [Gammaproteobacteria bacterium]|nr:HAMP domain-containing protein [Gammaproteobacteria bacterium]
MNSSWSRRLVTALLPILVIALVAVLWAKPRVDHEFHALYSENLAVLQSLPLELEREHRDVRYGLTSHYDFLEATMQRIEKAAALLTLPPAFVDADFRLLVTSATERYLPAIKRIRTHVESTKRHTGLLRNSIRAGRRLLDAQADKMRSTDAASGLLVPLYRYFGDLDAISAKERATPRELLSQLPPSLFVDQLRLHLDLVHRLLPELVHTSEALREELRTATEPRTVRDAYQRQYFAATEAIQRALFASYAIAGLLILVVLFHMQGAQRAQRHSAALARDLSLQLERTKNVVAECSVVLDDVSLGRFERRVSDGHEGDLGELAGAVNAAAGRIEGTVAEISRVMGEVREGHFDVRVGASLQGTLRGSVKDAMTSLERTFASIQRTMQDMAAGQFSSRVDVDARGDLARLKDSVNDSMQALQSAVHDVSTVVIAQSQGDLTRRIDGEFAGDIGVLAQAVNRSTETLGRSIANVRTVCNTVNLASDEVQHNAQNMSAAATDQLAALDRTLVATNNISARIEDSTTAIASAAVLAGS